MHIIKPNLLRGDAMQNCNKCGNEIKKDDLFCTKCGNGIELVCKKCGYHYGAEDKFCEVCGDKLVEDVDVEFAVPNNEQRQAKQKRKSSLILAAVIVFVTVVGVGAYHYFNRDKTNKIDNEQTAKSNSSVLVEQNGKNGKVMSKEKKIAATPDVIKGNSVIGSAELEYLTYKDSKFGYSIDYPADFKFREDLRSENLNSKVFSNGEGQLIISGLNTLQNSTIKDYYENAIIKASARNVVGYNHLGDTWYVITYKSDGYIAYSKTLWGTGSNNHFVFSYPASKKNVYDPIVEHIEQSFYRGSTEVTH